MAKQIETLSEAAMLPLPALKDFINGMSCALVAKGKKATVHHAGLGAPTNLFNKTEAVENEHFQLERCP